MFLPGQYPSSCIASQKPWAWGRRASVTAKRKPSLGIWWFCDAANAHLGENAVAMSARTRAIVAPALAQTAGGTPNSGPQGTGNLVAGKPEGHGNFGLVQPDGSGPRSPVSRKATATSSKDRE